MRLSFLIEINIAVSLDKNKTSAALTSCARIFVKGFKVSSMLFCVSTR